MQKSNLFFSCAYAKNAMKFCKKTCYVIAESFSKLMNLSAIPYLNRFFFSNFKCF